MQERIEGRLEQLRQEFDAGQSRLRELETQEAFLRERLLMLKGAIQVLEELRDGEGRRDGAGPTPAAGTAVGTG
jgi:predicted nuclease with TOPRIM domain